MLRKLIFAGALLALSTAPSFAASRVWISECGVQSSAAFGGGTRYIRILCEVQCAVKGGSGATTSDMLIPALLPEYVGVQPGATISVIAAP